MQSLFIDLGSDEAQKTSSKSIGDAKGPHRMRLDRIGLGVDFTKPWCLAFFTIFP
jgi:hypothetical protein